MDNEVTYTADMLPACIAAASGDPATTPPTKAFDLARHDCAVAILAIGGKR